MSSKIYHPDPSRFPDRREGAAACQLVELTGMPWDKAIRHVRAEQAARVARRQLSVERRTSQGSGLILTFGQMLDHWVPFGLAGMAARAFVRRRIARRKRRA